MSGLKIAYQNNDLIIVHYVRNFQDGIFFNPVRKCGKKENIVPSRDPTASEALVFFVPAFLAR